MGRIGWFFCGAQSAVQFSSSNSRKRDSEIGDFFHVRKELKTRKRIEVHEWFNERWINVRTIHSRGIKISKCTMGGCFHQWSFGNWNQSLCTLIIVRRPTLRLFGLEEVQKYCSICTFEIAELNIDSISDRFCRFVSLREVWEFRWRHVCVAPAMFSIHRFICDTMITTGQEPESVLARKKRFLFPHERPTANARRAKQGAK